MISGLTAKELFIVKKMQGRIQDFAWGWGAETGKFGVIMRMQAHIMVKGLGAFSGGGGGQLPLKRNC